MNKWYLTKEWGGGEIIATVRGNASKAYKKARELSKKLGYKVVICQPFDYPPPPKSHKISLK